jgi:hypothetical protein
MLRKLALMLSISTLTLAHADLIPYFGVNGSARTVSPNDVQLTNDFGQAGGAWKATRAPLH